MADDLVAAAMIMAVRVDEAKPRPAGKIRREEELRADLLAEYLACYEVLSTARKAKEGDSPA